MTSKQTLFERLEYFRKVATGFGSVQLNEEDVTQILELVSNSLEEERLDGYSEGYYSEEYRVDTGF